MANNMILGSEAFGIGDHVVLVNGSSVHKDARKRPVPSSMGIHSKMLSVSQEESPYQMLHLQEVGEVGFCCLSAAQSVEL